MRLWKKLTHSEIKARVFGALEQNVNYYNANILGIPASHLDNKVFYQDAPFLSNAPFLSTLIHNPNHIGCHTLGKSEHFFKGTQEIEKELIRICSEEILRGRENAFDGYVASGGTEANMQAIWIYRNYFKEEHQAAQEEMCIICSEDSHYSSSKAANVLHLDIAYIDVDTDNRLIKKQHLEDTIRQQQQKGKKYFIVIANMMTTMFGSVDPVDLYVEALEAAGSKYKIHVDGAFGGFFFPFSTEENKLDFSNSKITSVTLDAHKMLQAPYGTGIFLIRKNFIGYANTKEASYVEGEDYTLIGSRSGANAIAVWMILMTNGPYGWREKILVLLNRTDWLCAQLQQKNIEYYRQAGSNIVTIKSHCISPDIATKYGLVPDNHQNPRWHKIVVMEHVTIEKLEPLVEEL
ncbi:L-tyrosine decarboxylase [Fulvivirga imtechensis AK7]|uniref:L-tyrosine decarboxylase n=1 Tax=Fulvivirga imtechensis AK7 TaxID=1237149 RepID=L8K1G7_9BACT|nr:pyridoxal-dependent decarboxylase [Fulvivirga imtechensis]ELR73759.1 L-tyrosine decarboxylase [Fulvivirga imtechensis AK7]